jgi:hypothetical protein
MGLEKDLSGQVNQVTKKRGPLRNLRSLLVGYALVDLVWNFLSVQLSVAKSVAEGINPLYTPFYIHRWGDSLLFLIASVGLKLHKSWTYLVSILATGWIIYRGVGKWERIAEVGLNVPMWSVSVIKSWWLYHGGRWDFPRLILAAAVLLYCVICVIRGATHKALRKLHP